MGPYPPESGFVLVEAVGADRQRWWLVAHVLAATGAVAHVDEVFVVIHEGSPVTIGGDGQGGREHHVAFGGLAERLGGRQDAVQGGGGQ